MDTRLPTDPDELLAALTTAREVVIPPTVYRYLLQQCYLALATRKAGIELSQWDPTRVALLTDV